MSLLRYVVLHQEEDGGYWVESPSLSGRFSQGDTHEEALEKIQEAIEAYIESRQKHGESVPEAIIFEVMLNS